MVSLTLSKLSNGLTCASTSCSCNNHHGLVESLFISSVRQNNLDLPAHYIAAKVSAMLQLGISCRMIQVLRFSYSALIG